MKAPTPARHLKLAGLLVLCVLVGGTLGYIFIEHLSFLDALYTTVDMMATVGSVVHPLTPAGRMFTIAVIIFGVSALLYTLSAGMEFMLEGHLSRAVKRSLMESKIARMRDHAIICGFGRVGSQIAEDCARDHRPFVVIDAQEEHIQTCFQRGYLAIQGDATTDAALREAGVQSAHSLLVATDDDAHNISITLSARYLNKHLFIIARANHDEAEAKLKRAGADRVLGLYALGGHHMANLAFQPDVMELGEIMTQTEKKELAVREIYLEKSSPLIGKAVVQAQALLNHGLTIVALKKHHGLLVSPQHETVIEEGDTIIVVGVPELS
jgi:voltage-gated potassium channel